MTLQITTTNHIIIDGRDTGLGLAQRADKTVVYVREGLGKMYKEIDMPHKRYSAAHDSPASGAAGRAQLEADVLSALALLANVK